MGNFLSEGEILSCDRFPIGSNYTFLVKIGNRKTRDRFAIYKPKHGEVYNIGGDNEWENIKLVIKGDIIIIS